MEGAFPVTMLPGDGVGPELMHAVKEVFKVSALGRDRDDCLSCKGFTRFSSCDVWHLFLKAASVPVEFQEHHLSEVQNMASEEKLEQVLSSMKENKVAIIGMCAE